MDETPLNLYLGKREGCETVAAAPDEEAAARHLGVTGPLRLLGPASDRVRQAGVVLALGPKERLVEMPAALFPKAE